MPSAGGEAVEVRAKADYRSFLVRCWRPGAAEEYTAAWRFMVVEAGGGKPRRAFASMDDMVTHLRGELGIDQLRERTIFTEEVNGE